MVLQDSFFKVFLYFSNHNLIALILILGFLTYDRKIFGFLIFVIIFNMVLNSYLKSIWQIPLNAEVGKIGWAFPSGHTQGATLFWGFLVIYYRRIWFTITASILLILSVTAIVHFKYHNWIDIIGGFSFAVIEIVIFYIIKRILDKYNVKYYILGFLLTFIEILIYNILISNTQLSKWLIQFIVIGFSFAIGWCLSDHFKFNQRTKNYLFVTLYSLILCYVMIAIKQSNLAIYLQGISVGVSIGFLIPYIDSKTKSLKDKLILNMSLIIFIISYHLINS